MVLEILHESQEETLLRLVGQLGGEGGFGFGDGRPNRLTPFLLDLGKESLGKAFEGEAADRLFVLQPDLQGRQRKLFLARQAPQLLDGGADVRYGLSRATRWRRSSRLRPLLWSLPRPW